MGGEVVFLYQDLVTVKKQQRSREKDIFLQSFGKIFNSDSGRRTLPLSVHRSLESWRSDALGTGEMLRHAKRKLDHANCDDFFAQHSLPENQVSCRTRARTEEGFAHVFK